MLLVGPYTPAQQAAILVDNLWQAISRLEMVVTDTRSEAANVKQEVRRLLEHLRFEYSDPPCSDEDAKFVQIFSAALELIKDSPQEGNTNAENN